MSLNLLAEVKSGKPLSADAKAELKKIMSKNLVKNASMGNVYDYHLYYLTNTFILIIFIMTVVLNIRCTEFYN